MLTYATAKCLKHLKHAILTLYALVLLSNSTSIPLRKWPANYSNVTLRQYENICIARANCILRKVCELVERFARRVYKTHNDVSESRAIIINFTRLDWYLCLLSPVEKCIPDPLARCRQMLACSRYKNSQTAKTAEFLAEKTKQYSVKFKENWDCV